MSSKYWVGWRVLTEVLIVDYFIKNNISESKSFTTGDLIEKYHTTIRLLRPSNVDIRTTINQQLHELVMRNCLTKTIRGIYIITPQSTLMDKIYAKRFELEFEGIHNQN